MKELPRINIAHLPTAVEFLPNLTKLIDGPKIFVKRDDQTGLALGGNKARKLEFLVGEALDQGADTLITAGAVQSNHCRQTAAAAVRNQLNCTLILLGDEPDARTGNLLLDDLFGAKITWARMENRETALQEAFEESRVTSHKPYLIPYGGSNPVGATGYIHAMAELVEQWDDQRLGDTLPDWIILASGSGGTQAGLILGAREFHFPGRVIGISVDATAERLTAQIGQLVRETAAFLELDNLEDRPDIHVSSDYLGRGYGVVGQPEVDAIQIFARSEGLLLDPVYTGRAAAGMLDMISNGIIQQHESVLFWHTGGAPALFASQYSRIFIENSR